MAWEHGSLAGYTYQRCRCDACRKAWRDYRREYERDRASSGRRTVSAAETRRHVRRLKAAGWATAAIADRAGLVHHTVRKIESGKTRRVRLQTADRLLAITVDETLVGHRVPARLARPLLRDFKAAGISGRKLYAAAGLSEGWCATRHRTHVDWGTWRRLTVVHRLLARRGVVTPRTELEEAVSA